MASRACLLNTAPLTGHQGSNPWPSVMDIKMVLSKDEALMYIKANPEAMASLLSAFTHFMHKFLTPWRTMSPEDRLLVRTVYLDKFGPEAAAAFEVLCDEADRVQ